MEMPKSALAFGLAVGLATAGCGHNKPSPEVASPAYGTGVAALAEACDEQATNDYTRTQCFDDAAGLCIRKVEDVRELLGLQRVTAVTFSSSALPVITGIVPTEVDRLRGAFDRCMNDQARYHRK